jgi:hypothetical protein
MQGRLWILVAVMVATVSSALLTSGDPLDCVISFSEWAESVPPALHCPAGCLQFVQRARRDHDGVSGFSSLPPSAHVAAVYGSWPYHPRSAVCLAGIHSGLITEAEGGWVMFDAFPAYHQPVVLDMTQPAADTARLLSNGSTYSPLRVNVSGLELFPFNSSLPALSNGVQSLHAAEAWAVGLRQLPNVSITEVSMITFARGSIVAAVARPPFSARSGHLQVAVTAGSLLFHLVIGGRNGTHYLVSQAAHSSQAPCCAER